MFSPLICVNQCSADMKTCIAVSTVHYEPLGFLLVSLAHPREEYVVSLDTGSMIRLSAVVTGSDFAFLSQRWINIFAALRFSCVLIFATPRFHTFNGENRMVPYLLSQYICTAADLPSGEAPPFLPPISDVPSRNKTTHLRPQIYFSF